MMEKNDKRMGWGMAVAAMLIGMAFIGMLSFPLVEAAPGDKTEPILAEDLMDFVETDPGFAYNTSTQSILISWDWPETLDDHLSPSDVTVSLLSSSMAMDTDIYTWNWTDDGFPFPESYSWNLPPEMQPATDYIINVTALVFNNNDGNYYYDGEETGFEILAGAPMIEDITADPMTVANSGGDMVNITLMFNRNFDEIDTVNTDAMFFHVDTMSWVSDEVLEIPDPSPENMTEGVHNVSAYSHMVIPEDLPVGEYKLYMNASDIWGYYEIFNETLFTVVWKEMPPLMTNGTVHMMEDSYAVVDLDDHFSDLNEQELMYYINISEVEVLTITWEDEAENVINITAPMDVFGTYTFELNVTDGIENVTFEMTVIIEGTPDDIRMIENPTVMVPENVGAEVAFDPHAFFYDPDGVEAMIDAVSLGTVEMNGTEVPAWNWTDGNFTITVNESDTTDGAAMLIADLETGMATFPLYAWYNNSIVLEGDAVVKIDEVNDVPMPSSDTLEVFRNEPRTFNLSALFVDPDSTYINFTVNTSMTENVQINYDWETFDLTIVPDDNFTGTTEFIVNATDGMDYGVYTMNVNVIPRSYTVTGTISFEDIEGIEVNLSNVTLLIGSVEVELDEEGGFEILLVENDYEVTLSLPENLTYSGENERSGYVISGLDPINLTADQTYDIEVEWMVYEPTGEQATWDDLDFSDVIIEEDDEWEVIVNVKEGSENKTGFDLITVILHIIESDDEEFNFTLEWDADEMRFYVLLTEDDMEDLGEGKKEYYFTNEDGSERTENKEYEFKGEDDSAGPMTIIILVALIILVLVALIFIMKKPSDEEFDEEEEEEGEEEGRTCPGCGEVVTDDEAEECPYCGEDMEEE